MSGLKQRIIGALVLIALAVIFVPMMFDEPHDERSVRSLDIPEEPPFPEVQIPETEEPVESEVPDYRVEELEPASPTHPADRDSRQVTTPGQPQSSSQDPQVPPAEDQMATVGESDVPPSEAEDIPEVSQPEVGGTDNGEAGDRESRSEPGTAATDQREQSDVSNQSENDSADFERSLEGAWVLQLGSFGDADNARGLRDKIRERGYGAHLQEVTRGDSNMVRVFSGPFADKSEAEKAKEVLDKAFGVNSLVTKGKD